MKAGKYGIILVMLVLAVCSCKSKLSDADYITHVEDESNGLRRKVVVDNWEYDMQYKPGRYVLLRERVDGNDKEAYARRLKQLQGVAWFNIAVKRSDVSTDPLKYNVNGIDEYNARLDYFLNSAGGQLVLKYEGKTIYPSVYLFENNYGLTPQATMVVGFPLPGHDAPREDMTLSYHDRLFNNGIIKATFSKANLIRSSSL